MRCAYLGLARGAVALARAGHQLTAAGLGRAPTSIGWEALRGALPPSCPILLRPDLGAPAVRDLLTSTGADLLVCYLWPRLIPAALLEGFPPGRAIGYHPSLLPRHRGADPYFWTLWAGDDQAGASIFCVEPGLDRGLILAQRELMVEPGWTGGDLAEALDDLGLELLLEVLGRWERTGQPPEGRPQDEAGATLAPAPDEALLELDLRRPAAELARLVRAASPHPGAYTVLDDGRVLTVVEVEALRLAAAGALRPGDVVRLDAGVTLWTGEGGLALREVRLGEAPDQPLRDVEVIAALFADLPDLRADGA